MTITEINIQLVKPANGLVAFASIVLEGRIYLGSIAVHQKLNGSGFRLTYPTKKTGSRDFHIFHPIERGLGRQIEQAILSKITGLLSKKNLSSSTHSGEDGDVIL